jgi:hypothetical protein
MTEKEKRWMCKGGFCMKSIETGGSLLSKWEPWFKQWEKRRRGNVIRAKEGPEAEVRTFVDKWSVYETMGNMKEKMSVRSDYMSKRWLIFKFHQSKERVKPFLSCLLFSFFSLSLSSSLSVSLFLSSFLFFPVLGIELRV